MHQKLVPDPRAENSHWMQESLFKIGYFEKGLSKNLNKVNFVFSFKSSPL